MRLYLKYLIPWLKELKTLHANRKVTAEYAALSKLMFAYPTLKQYVTAEEFRRKLIIIAKARRIRQYSFTPDYKSQLNH